jgi:glycosyltransferase involved in cell wall biosynthesis
MSSKVSIIIPTFNRAHLIQETLDSVFDQLYINWECIIVDDGSFDNSIAIINFYVKKDNRFKLIIRPNHRIKGASTCRNIGVANSTGNFIQFLDSDDLLSPNKISEQIKLLEYCSENVISTCKWGRFSINLKDSNILENLATYETFDNPLLFLDALSISKGYFPPNAYLIKADLVKKVGLWNEHLTINDDGEFMMRVIANTEKIYFASDAIAYYRHTNTTNLSNYNNKENVNDAIYSWKIVDSYLKIRFKEDVISYVEIMKSVLYNNVKNSFPELIFKHEYFFKKQLEDHKLWRRIKAKIKLRLTKL